MDGSLWAKNFWTIATGKSHCTEERLNDRLPSLRRDAMQKKSDRTLIVIGGAEDKVGDKDILAEVARRVGSGKLVITTAASKDPTPLFEDYDRVFRSLGVKHIAKLEINHRA